MICLEASKRALVVGEKCESFATHGAVAIRLEACMSAPVAGEKCELFVTHSKNCFSCFVIRVASLYRGWIGIQMSILLDVRVSTMPLHYITLVKI